jgi:hypothetical protein
MMQATALRIREAPSHDTLTSIQQLMNGQTIAQAIVVATELGIPDLLAKGPQTAAELARQCAADEASLYRLLRSLTAVGLFAQPHYSSHFELSPLSERLRTDHPQSLRDFVLLRGDPVYSRAWSELKAAVKTGATAFTQAHGVSHCEYLDSNPAISLAFSRGMRSVWEQAADLIAKAYDFSRFGKLLDLGSDDGVLVAAILNEYPLLRGMLLELPSALEQSRAVLSAAHVLHRCAVIPGDFLITMPKGADAITLSRLLQHLNDNQAVRVLGNCRAALPSHGKLLIVESVITEGRSGAAAKINDLQMMVQFGTATGRSADQYEALLVQAGFSLGELIVTPTGMSVLEAKCH